MSAKVLVERMELVRHIVDEAQRLVPSRICFHWSHACQVLPHPKCASTSPKMQCKAFAYSMIL